jgi:hypothetical protein
MGSQAGPLINYLQDRFEASNEAVFRDFGPKAATAHRLLPELLL